MNITLNDISKEYVITEKGNTIFKKNKRRIQALKNVSFEIKSGEVCGLIGLNGAGKSTLTKLLCGVLSETSGEIQLTRNGEKISAEEQKKYISVIFGHRGQLWNDLQVIDSYDIISRIYEIPKKEFNKRLEWLDGMLQLNELIQRPARQLSLGQRMKCEIAGSLLNMPEILLLDEPTIGLDILTKEKIYNVIKEIHKETGNTIILTSHDLRDVGELCERILILNKGELIFDGLLSSLYEEYATEYIINIKTAGISPAQADISSLLNSYKDSIRNVECKDNNICIYVDKEDNSVPFKIMEILEQTLSPEDFSLSSAGFEQIIRNIYA